MTWPLTPVAAIQRGLEALYRVDTELDVRDFLVTRAQRDELSPPSRSPREQLLVSSDSGDTEVELALYLDEGALADLSRHDPRDGVNDHNLPALLLALEGVSHFIYMATRAQQGRPVSALELELQAEVDKFVTLLLLSWSQDRTRADLPEFAEHLITRLFRRVVYDPLLSPEEHERYREANAAAASFAGSLRRRYIRHPHPSDQPALLQEVRQFWRLSCADKLSHINRRT